ncbi:hypothetical protein PS718_03562 [Pseudomonas fluorescens]|uniref:Uncharacterized protein n=1 Tax=Pseudomonas fluorescens TaxID=294 RepID=A0A5E7DVU4_PSEFL|nr:hypothetical protein PS718_03562 [Pseudomonas fluorescens]
MAGNRGLHFAAINIRRVGWRGEVHRPLSGAGSNVDDCAVGQGHGHGGAGRVAQSRGVGDLATLGHGAGRTQRQIGGVDRIGHRSHGRRFVRHQIFVVAAAGAVDLHAQGVATRECIVRCSEVDAAAAGADRDGDGLSVGQGHDNRRTRNRRGDGRGVNHYATFNGAGRGGQRYGAVVDGVGNVGDSRGLVDHQVLEVAAGSFGDARVDFAGVLVHVIARCCDGGGAGSRAFGDVDHRAVAQGHGHGRAGCIGQCGGVDDRAALGDRTGRAQADIGGVDGVGDGGDHGRAVGIDLLEVAAAVAGNRGLHFAAINIRRVGWRGEVHRPLSGAGSNVDDCAVGQGHGHGGAGRVAQSRGVGDLATFADGVACGQGQAGLVDGVIDGGADRRLADVELLEVAAAGIGHGHGELADVFIDVIARCRNGHRTRGFTGLDGDGLAVAEVDGYRRLRGVGQGRGVGDRRAFEHIAFGAEGQVRGVDRVGNVCDRRRGARNEALEVAAGSVLDGHFDFAGVFIDVIGRCRNSHGAGGLAGVDGDGRAVAQGHGHRGAGRVVQGRGVDDLPAFVDVTGGSQRNGGGVDGVGHGGADRVFVSDQIFVVAAGYVGDRVGQRCMAGQYIVRCGRGRGACGLAHGNGDALAVCQGHHDR